MDSHYKNKENVTFGIDLIVRFRNKCGMNTQGGYPTFLGLIPFKFADVSCQEFPE